MLRRAVKEIALKPWRGPAFPFGCGSGCQGAETCKGGRVMYLRAENFLTMARHAEVLALLDELDHSSAKTEKTASLRIRVHLDRKDYPALVQHLRAYKQNFGVALGRQNYFKDLDSHAFLTSPEFVAWEKESTTGAN